MPATSVKQQPWKALISLEEDPKPDFSKLSDDEKKEPAVAIGNTVSKPMDRKTAQHTTEDMKQ